MCDCGFATECGSLKAGPNRCRACQALGLWLQVPCESGARRSQGTDGEHWRNEKQMGGLNAGLPGGIVRKVGGFGRSNAAGP